MQKKGSTLRQSAVNGLNLFLPALMVQGSCFYNYARSFSAVYAAKIKGRRFYTLAAAAAIPQGTLNIEAVGSATAQAGTSSTAATAGANATAPAGTSAQLQNATGATSTAASTGTVPSAQASAGAMALPPEGVSATSAPASTVADAAPAYMTPPEYSWSGYFMGIGMLFIMMAMLWAGARFLKQKGALRFLGQSSGFKVTNRLSLGTKKHLLELEYRGKKLLLGVTEHQISVLNSEPLNEFDEEDSSAFAQYGSPAQTGSIKTKFKEFLNGADTKE
ncbi:flagellar biosynthetic protein FliO [Desulfovibrio sp. OttesenSCG-928-F07]|nr:flagellar biosynthetic protein FliO [Desulfovibrio sp. OttesenSCG-928-F07]